MPHNIFDASLGLQNTIIEKEQVINCSRDETTRSVEDGHKKQDKQRTVQ